MASGGANLLRGPYRCRFPAAPGCLMTGLPLGAGFQISCFFDFGLRRPSPWSVPVQIAGGPAVVTGDPENLVPAPGVPGVPVLVVVDKYSLSASCRATPSGTKGGGIA